MSGVEDAASDSRRNYKAPYTAQHPIPTVREYREEKERRKTDGDGGHEEGNGTTEKYGAENKNISARSSIADLKQSKDNIKPKPEPKSDDDDDDKGGSDPDQFPEDTSQAATTETDAKAK